MHFWSFQVCLIICAVLSASAAVCPQDSEISPCKCTNPESPIVSCDASATDGTQLRQVFQNFAKGPIQDVLISNIKGDFSVPADFFYGTQLTGNFTFTCQEFHFDYPTKYMNFDNESFVSDGKWISPTYLGFDGCHMEHMGPQVLSGMTSLVSNSFAFTLEKEKKLILPSSKI